jgi:hypothetical protein
VEVVTFGTEVEKNEVMGKVRILLQGMKGAHWRQILKILHREEKEIPFVLEDNGKNSSESGVR